MAARYTKTGAADPLWLALKRHDGGTLAGWTLATVTAHLGGRGAPTGAAPRPAVRLGVAAIERLSLVQAHRPNGFARLLAAEASARPCRPVPSTTCTTCQLGPSCADRRRLAPKRRAAAALRVRPELGTYGCPDPGAYRRLARCSSPPCAQHERLDAYLGWFDGPLTTAALPTATGTARTAGAPGRLPGASDLTLDHGLRRRRSFDPWTPGRPLAATHLETQG